MKLFVSLAPAVVAGAAVMAAGLAAVTAGLGATAAVARAPLHSMALPVQATAAAGCPSGHGTRRNRANPLDLPTRPGSNPLRGADLFIDGPAHGMAAGAIAQLLHRDPASFGTISWPRFERYLASGAAARLLRRDPGLAHRVNLLRKIASEPETARFSSFSAGGGPGAVLSQARKFLCRMRATDRHAVPLIATYFLNHQGDCAVSVDGPSAQAVFRRRVRELAKALGNFPFVMLAELDAVTTAPCLSAAGLAARIAEMKYEVDTFAALPHGVVYVEGGASDADSARFAASVLNRVDVRRIRGFFLGDTHFAWTSDEIAFGDRVSALTHGSHFIVNTAANGRGPLLNRDPVRQGIEDLCNPPGRGLGPRPRTSTAFAAVDAFEWTGTPGRSAGDCGAGHAPPGAFDLGLALGLAARANDRIGPGYPSHRY